MADINVERKPGGGGRNPLLWLLGLVLLGLLLWALLRGLGGRGEPVEPAYTDTAAVAAPAYTDSALAPAPGDTAAMGAPGIVGADTTGQAPLPFDPAVPDATGAAGTP